MRKELQRDAGLDRLARTTRWLTAGAVVSAGGLSLAVANSFPGHSSKPAPARTTTTPAPTPASTPQPAPTTAPPSAASGSPATAAPTDPPTTLSPPTAPPQVATTVPVVSSGGS